MAGKKRSTKGKAQPRKAGITAQDMNWGCIFKGPKEALQAAGLLPAKFKIDTTYWIPLTWKHCGDGPRWDARAQECYADEAGLLSVWVNYTKDKDLAVRDRLAPVLQAVEGIRHLVMRAQNSHKAAVAAVFALDDVREQLNHVAPPKLSEVVPQAIMEARHAQA